MAESTDGQSITGPTDPVAAARAAVAEYFATNAANSAKKGAAPASRPPASAPRAASVVPQPVSPAAVPRLRIPTTGKDVQGREVPITDAMKDAMRDWARKNMREIEGEPSPFEGWTAQERARWDEYQKIRTARAGAQSAPQQPESAPSAAPPAANDLDIDPQTYNLQFPAPDGQAREEDLVTAQAFEAAAFNAGLPLETAQAGLDAVLDAGAAFGARYEGTSESADDCEVALRASVGHARAEEMLKLAAHNARELGIEEFLETPGGDGRCPGNNLGVVAVLANAGLLKLTKEAAAEELSKWMASTDYRRGDPNALVAVNLLSKRAYADDKPSKVVNSTKRAVEAAQHEIAAVQKQADANVAAKALLAEMKKGGPAAEAAEKKWLTLVAKL